MSQSIFSQPNLKEEIHLPNLEWEKWIPNRGVGVKTAVSPASITYLPNIFQHKEGTWVRTRPRTVLWSVNWSSFLFLDGRVERRWAHNVKRLPASVSSTQQVLVQNSVSPGVVQTMELVRNAHSQTRLKTFSGRSPGSGAQKLVFFTNLLDDSNVYWSLRSAAPKKTGWNKRMWLFRKQSIFHWILRCQNVAKQMVYTDRHLRAN